MRPELRFRPCRSGAAWLVAALLTGCATGGSSPRTEMQLADGAAFSQARTFSIKSEENAVTTSSAAEDAKVRAAIERRIRATLENKGYQYATTGADLEVSYHGIVLGRQSGSERVPVPKAYTPIGPGDPFSAYEPIAGAGSESGTVATGMLLILVVDTKTDAPVWQGTTTGTGTTPASAVGAAERATERLLHEVPKRAR
jgi:hypothetical protein